MEIYRCILGRESRGAVGCVKFIHKSFFLQTALALPSLGLLAYARELRLQNLSLRLPLSPKIAIPTPLPTSVSTQSTSSLIPTYAHTYPNLTMITYNHTYTFPPPVLPLSLHIYLPTYLTKTTSLNQPTNQSILPTSRARAY